MPSGPGISGWGGNSEAQRLLETGPRSHDRPNHPDSPGELSGAGYGGAKACRRRPSEPLGPPGEHPHLCIEYGAGASPLPSRDLCVPTGPGQRRKAHATPSNLSPNPVDTGLRRYDGCVQGSRQLSTGADSSQGGHPHPSPLPSKGEGTRARHCHPAEGGTLTLTLSRRRERDKRPGADSPRRGAPSP